MKLTKKAFAILGFDSNLINYVKKSILINIEIYLKCKSRFSKTFELLIQMRFQCKKLIYPNHLYEIKREKAFFLCLYFHLLLTYLFTLNLFIVHPSYHYFLIFPLFKYFILTIYLLNIRNLVMLKFYILLSTLMRLITSSKKFKRLNK